MSQMFVAEQEVDTQSSNQKKMSGYKSPFQNDTVLWKGHLICPHEI